MATDVDHPWTMSWVMLQSCFESHFMLRLEKQEKPHGRVQFSAGNFMNMNGMTAVLKPGPVRNHPKDRCLVVQFIGDQMQADQFAYQLELNGHGRRFTLEATPRSIREDVDRYENVKIRKDINFNQKT